MCLSNQCMYVKVLKEIERKYRVVAFFFFDRSVLFLSSPLENAEL